MKLTSLIFLSALPLTFVAILAGAPALPALAFSVPVLLLAIAANDYNRPARHYQPVARHPIARPRVRARLPLAA